MTVAQLDELPDEAAAGLLRACCGASRWVERMVARRPYHTRAALLDAADAAWSAMGADDWREAFAHHPRIGERAAAAAQDARAQGWSAAEQAGASAAPPTTQAQLAEANREYEDRFGHIYIVCASGRSAEELLAIARARLQNAPDVEIRVAAAEQHAITRLRLTKLLPECA